MARITPDVLVFFLTFSVLLAFLAMMLGAWALGPGPDLARDPAAGRGPAVDLRRGSLGSLHGPGGDRPLPGRERLRLPGVCGGHGPAHPARGDGGRADRDEAGKPRKAADESPGSDEPAEAPEQGAPRSNRKAS